MTLVCLSEISAQHSVARQWNDVLLEAIRNDNARPTVHARNLYHISAAMYDGWAAYQDEADFCFLGRTIEEFEFVYQGIEAPADVQAARDMAVSYAAYRLIKWRFRFAPGRATINQLADGLMNELGYDRNYTAENYQSGTGADLGNYIASRVIAYGFVDQSNEQSGYANQYYQPSNSPLVIEFSGNPTMTDPNRWQQLTLDVFIDQSGNPVPFNTPPFLSPEWGRVHPFAMSEEDLTIAQRDGDDYWIYHDPGPPPYLESDGSGESDLYKWNFELVAIWGSHLDPADTTRIDISPASIGNIESYPEALEDYEEFYDLLDGGDPSRGYPINPVTGEPYEVQQIKRADYARVLAEFWADGPESETPPGHWYTILNYVMDHPSFEKRYRGEYAMEDLEWDVKAYLTMGGAMHDCAISAWGIKGFYDYPRPVSVIRYMAEKGQSSDPSLPNYHPEGFRLRPGYIELVTADDELAAGQPANIGEVKIWSWRGPEYINNPANDVAGVGWILAKDWWPYQRPTFVTPPFAGYLSGHSTYSSAAADVMEFLTGSPYFPDGLGEFSAEANEFLVFEDGPSEDVVLQWASYKDASEQTSLSRIWGGIHPPVDDIRGRLIGTEIAADASSYANELFYDDLDQDGFYSYEDCDDTNPDINPLRPEICNGVDDDCNGDIDDGLQVFTYYEDADGDGYGDVAVALDTCLQQPPQDYVTNNQDCDDTNPSINPSISEVCNDVDDDCSGVVDDNLVFRIFYEDQDRDGYGNASVFMEECHLDVPEGYSLIAGDCDDLNDEINPSATERCNDVDDDCSGEVDDDIPYYTYYEDSDSDSYGHADRSILICNAEPPEGFVTNSDDCDDSNPAIYPGASEVGDNGVDEDCNGIDLYLVPQFFPNPVQDIVEVRYNTEKAVSVALYDMAGRRILWEQRMFENNFELIDLSKLASGVYVLLIYSTADQETLIQSKVVKM